MFLRTAAEPNSWPPQVEQHVGARPRWKPSRHAKNSALRHAAHDVATRGEPISKQQRADSAPFFALFAVFSGGAARGSCTGACFIVLVWAACHWIRRLEVPTQWRIYYNIIHMRLQDSWRENRLNLGAANTQNVHIWVLCGINACQCNNNSVNAFSVNKKQRYSKSSGLSREEESSWSPTGRTASLGNKLQELSSCTVENNQQMLLLESGCVVCQTAQGGIIVMEARDGADY